LEKIYRFAVEFVSKLKKSCPKRKAMSNKKRRNRDKLSSEAIGLGLSKSSDKQTGIIALVDETIEPNQSSKPGWFGYLKSHWWMIAVIAFLSIGVLGAGLKYLDEDAKREISRRADNKGQLNNSEEQSLLSKVNPFLPTPTPAPTPQLSKEYIYAGGKLLAVEDANAIPIAPADLAVWRPSTGQWWVMEGQYSQPVTQNWGTSGDIPVPGDYDGDGKTDFCIFRPSANQWWILKSSDGTYYTREFGATGDLPVPADYDGDGKTDIALFTTSSQLWYISQSSNNSMITPSLGTGNTINTPAPADYDGDGRADIGGWKNDNYTFYYKKSTDQTVPSQSLGILGVPVPGDYDGDGKADISIWSPSNTTWYYWKSSNPSIIVSHTFGIGTDLAVHNDYDGDGKMDMALWRAVKSAPKNNDVGKWIIRQSSKIGQQDEIREELWGTTGDIPVPAYYRR
jgi:hypothetical protein